MSASNVLPSAPPENRMYPVLPREEQPHDFRMQKANEVLLYLNEEIVKYRLVAKKYKRAKTIVTYSCGLAGGVSGVLSGGTIAAALTGIGVPAAVPIGATAFVFGLTASGLTGLYKKLEPKLIKHCKILTLAMSKCDTVNRKLSSALVDGRISDAEFQDILRERERYEVQKQIFRQGTLPKVQEKPGTVDIEKIKEEGRQEERVRLQKKLLGSKTDVSK